MPSGARRAQPVERKALNLVVVGLSPTVGALSLQDITAPFNHGLCIPPCHVSMSLSKAAAACATSCRRPSEFIHHRIPPAAPTAAHLRDVRPHQQAAFLQGATPVGGVPHCRQEPA